METKLVTLDVSLAAPLAQLRSAIAHSELLRSDALRSHVESVLAEQGTPLRWAITSVDKDHRTAQVEAIVTTLA